MRRVVPALLLVLAGGCAGDGTELVTGDGGNGMMTGGDAPTLSDVWQNTLGVICTECHVPGGPGPFSVEDEATAFASLVGVDSFEIPTLKRVDPGNPDGSYLLWKVMGQGPQGEPIVLSRMPPPPRPMLSAGQINEILQWIEAGADP